MLKMNRGEKGLNNHLEFPGKVNSFVGNFSKGSIVSWNCMSMYYKKSIFQKIYKKKNKN